MKSKKLKEIVQLPSTPVALRAYLQERHQSPSRLRNRRLHHVDSDEQKRRDGADLPPPVGVVDDGAEDGHGAGGEEADNHAHDGEEGGGFEAVHLSRAL